MVQIVYDILKPLSIPVEYIVRPDISVTKTGISYHFFNQGYELYGDGRGKEFGGTLQIDIFSTVDFTNIVNQVKNLMEINKFRLTDMRDSDDSMSSLKYLHKILIFNYSEKEVLSSGS